MDDIEELENKLKTSKDNIHLYNKKNNFMEAIKC